MVAPPWIAQIERTWIGSRADRRTTEAADHRAGPGIAGQRADRRTGTRAQKAAGHRPVARSGSAGGERQSGGKHRGRGTCLCISQQHFRFPILGFEDGNGGLYKSFPAFGGANISLNFSLSF